VDLGLEDGQRLRLDTTVVQTDIHHRTTIRLWDVVRVVTRLIGRLRSAGTRVSLQVVCVLFTLRRAMNGRSNQSKCFSVV
jgi:hypothetical protein